MNGATHSCDGVGEFALFICVHPDFTDRVQVWQMGEVVTISHKNLPTFIQQLKMYNDSIDVEKPGDSV